MGRNNKQRRAASAKDRRAASRTGHGARNASDGMSAFGPVGGSGPGPAPEPPPPRDHLREWLSRALAGLDSGDEVRTREAFDHLAAACVPGRPACARLSQLLVDAVGQAWARGWQPADLHRVTARHLGEPAAAVLGDAIVVQLGAFAPATIHPRWHEQLLAIEALRWWDPSADFLTGRLRRAGLDRIAVVEAFVRVLHLHGRLPGLARLDALPGSYRGPVEEADGRGADQRILTRVRQLLAKAESTNFEAEAETFTAGAQALMARHSIDAAMLAAADGPRREGTDAMRIGIDRPYEKPKAMLLGVVADANRCRAVWSEAWGFSTVVGFPDDVRATETLFTSLLVQSARSMAAHGRRQSADGRSRTRSFRSSFLMSFACRIGERLAQVTREETEAASRTRTGGRDLVRVLADRSEAVTEATSRLFPEVSHAAFSGGTDAEGWYAGRRAADAADVGAGPPVARG